MSKLRQKENNQDIPKIFEKYFRYRFYSFKKFTIDFNHGLETTLESLERTIDDLFIKLLDATNILTFSSSLVLHTDLLVSQSTCSAHNIPGDCNLRCVLDKW